MEEEHQMIIYRRSRRWQPKEGLRSADQRNRIHRRQIERLASSYLRQKLSILEGSSEQSELAE